jgi:hypothetical protein
VRKIPFCVVVAVWFGFTLQSLGSPLPADGNSPAATNASDEAVAMVTTVPTSSKAKPLPPRGKVGIALKVSSLGAGVETAVPVMGRADIRAGFNLLNYNRALNADGVTYVAKLNFRSSEAYFDWYPMHGSFHLSPGALFYNGNNVTANALIPGKQTLTFENVSYSSDPKKPLTGTAQIGFRKIAPAFLVGWGNLLSRTHRRWSIPVEFGVVYQSAPQLALSFTGNACAPDGKHCQPVANNSTYQKDVADEQTKLNREISLFRFYPVISIGFGYKFGGGNRQSQ